MNGGGMRRLLLLVAVALTACGPANELGPAVTLPIADEVTAWGASCILEHEVMDVVPDPQTGAPANRSTGEVLVWPKGMTAHRSGTETVVFDPAGGVVMTTGGRYWVCPSGYLDSLTPWKGWVIGMARPCPDCTPGQGAD
jgi:hypothetical protein